MKLINYFPVPHEVLESKNFKGLSPATRLLYVYLVKLQNRLTSNEETSPFFRSVADLSKDLSISKATIKKSKKELVDQGLIEIHQGKHDSINNRHADYFMVKGLKEG